jgi:sugar transferase (PEP-CTERM system associated)
MAALFGDEASQQRHGTRLVPQGHWAEIGEHRSAAAGPHRAYPWTGVRVNRLFSFYFRRVTLRQVALDVALVFAVIAMSISSQIDSLALAVPLLGTHAASLAAGLFVINSASGFYEPVYTRSIGQSCARAIFALLLALPLTYAILSFLPDQLGNRQVLMWAAMAGVAGVIVRRVYVAHWASVPQGRSRVLVFGSGSAAAVVGDTLKASDPNVQIVGYVPGPNESTPAVPERQLISTGGPLVEIARQHKVDEIIVALTERRSGSMPLRELLDCKLVGVKVHDLSTHFEKTLGQIRIDYLNAGWLVFGDGFNQGTFRTWVKRTFDIVCASILIVVSAPIMLLAAIAIKLESRGPLLYRQERVGLNGTTFNVAKFRSMRTDAEKDGTPRWASANDDRVTRVGRIIRRLRIDELPQLFNVLKGEMSLVGPRPERPFFVEQLTQQIPFFAVRHSVKPGITGWAQVRYPYGATVEDSQEKLQFDLYYVKHHSLLLDMLILLETVSVVLTGKGAR